MASFLTDQPKRHQISHAVDLAIQIEQAEKLAKVAANMGDKVALAIYEGQKNEDLATLQDAPLGVIIGANDMAERMGLTAALVILDDELLRRCYAI